MLAFVAALPFPDRLAFGSVRRSGWYTGVIQTYSGHESTNQCWSEARHEFDASMAVRTVSLAEAMVDHFHAMRGRAKSFGFRDPLDSHVTAERGVLLPTDEDPNVFQMLKRYGSGEDEYLRRITRPVSPGVRVFALRGSETVELTDQATIDFGTRTTPGGTLTFETGALESDDILSWSGDFLVPCRYDIDKLPDIIINREPGQDGELYIQRDSIPIVEVRE